MSQPHPEGIPPSKHRTVALTELHCVGDSRRPAFHTVLQEVEALEPIDRVPYYINTGEIETIQGLDGCSPDGLQRFNNRLYVADMMLDQPLDSGERATVQYTTWFRYEQPPAPECNRRISRFGLELMDLTVRFEEKELPARIWWAEWEGETAEDALVIPESRIELGLQPVPEAEELPGMLQVQHVETDVPADTIRGIYWEWPA